MLEESEEECDNKTSQEVKGNKPDFIGDEEQESYVIDLTKNLISNTVKSFKDEKQQKEVDTATKANSASKEQPSTQAQLPKSKNTKKKRKQQKAAAKAALEQKEKDEKLKKE